MEDKTSINGTAEENKTVVSTTVEDNGAILEQKIQESVLPETIDKDGKTVENSTKAKTKKELKKESELIESDIFINENDSFTVTVKYYPVNKHEVMVMGLDDGFDENNKDIKSFNISFKYPSFYDSQIIFSGLQNSNKDQVGMLDLLGLQNNRLLVLFKSWTLSADKAKINQLNNKIVKHILNCITKEIGMDGIL